MNTAKYPITQEYLRSIHGMTVEEAVEFTIKDWFSQKGNQFGISYVPQRLEFLAKLKQKNKLEIEYYLGEVTGRRYCVALRSNVIYWCHVNTTQEPTEYQKILRSLKEIQEKSNSSREKNNV